MKNRKGHNDEYKLEKSGSKWIIKIRTDNGRYGVGGCFDKKSKAVKYYKLLKQ